MEPGWLVITLVAALAVLLVIRLVLSTSRSGNGPERNPFLRAGDPTPANDPQEPSQASRIRGDLGSGNSGVGG